MNRNGGDRDMCQDFFECVFTPVLPFPTDTLLSPINPGFTCDLTKRIDQGLSRMQESMGMGSNLLRKSRL